MDVPHSDFWQHFSPASPDPPEWHGAYAAPMPDGSRLMLPLRDLGEEAVAGLIVNQASFVVADRLTDWAAERAARFGVEVVLGLPTLGHVVAPGVARALGHPNWVAAGFSKKLWYEAALSVPVASVTSPESGRRMWLDPRVLPRLAGRRVLLVDDVMSTGRSMQAGLSLLRAADIRPVAVAVAMIQGDRWRADWPASVPVTGAFATPLFRRGETGWITQPETAPHELCEHHP
jgi:adenine/guanine phosphoribosyltransferase-like PRPP-binding protein